MTPEISQDEFLRALEHHQGIIYKITNAYCKDQEDRKDLVQEIIIQIWKSFGRYDNKYKMSTWIYRIALNVAISFYRQDRRRLTVRSNFDDGLINIKDEPGESEVEENLHLLNRFINELDPLNKALMILYLDSNSHKDIADVLGITQTNVATKIGRIKKLLKKRFDQEPTNVLNP